MTLELVPALGCCHQRKSELCGAELGVVVSQGGSWFGACKGASPSYEVVKYVIKSSPMATWMACNIPSRLKGLHDGRLASCYC